MRTSVLHLLLPLAFFAITSSSFAQGDDPTLNETFREKFGEANILLEDKYYGISLSLWEDLLAQDPDNANLNYKVGLCLFNISVERKSSLAYFEKAAQNITKNYDVFSHTEKKAPIDTYYYLGRTEHLNNRIDEAIAHFNKFKEVAHRKHFLNADIDEQLTMCQTAKELMADPVEVNISNLSKKINSPYPEYSPVISLDESFMFFTSRRLREDSSNAGYTEIADKLFFEDIYVTYKDKEGNWQTPELININRHDYHDATIGLSPDGQTIFLYQDIGGDGQLFKSTFQDTGWSNPEMLGAKINTNSYETHVTESADGTRLYVVSDRKGGYGGKDIWRHYKLPTGEWSEAENLGPNINTPKDEDGPFIHPDDKTLYFSSNGHRSMGGYDIFYSKLEEDSTWSKPKNIGYPINTTDDDVFYIMSPDGKRAYYSSSREGGQGKTDIYMIERPEEDVLVDLGGFALLKGYVIPSRGVDMPDDAEILITDNATGKLVGQSSPNPRNGSFVFIIPSGNSYHVVYSFNQKVYYEEDIEVPAGKEYQEIRREILMRPVEYGDPENLEVIVLEEDVLGENVRYQLLSGDAQDDLPTGLKMNYLDNTGQVVYTEYVSKEGFFRYHKLDGDQPLILQLVNEDDVAMRNLRIEAVGVEENDPDVGIMALVTEGRKEEYRFQDEKIALLAAQQAKEVGGGDGTGNDIKTRDTETVGDSKEATGPGSENTGETAAVEKPKAPPLVTFEQYFIYNRNKLKQTEREWTNFVNGIKQIVDERKRVTVSIEASASQVPTTTYGTNENLADIRAKKAKDALVRKLEAAGVDITKVDFGNIMSLVQGPEYKDDAVQNRKVYEQFQYVRMRAR